MSDHRRHLHVPEDMPIVARVRVLYADTDAMGVVYHGSYIRYLEHARIEYLRQRDTVYAEVEAAGYAVPVTELGARYTAPARFDDVLTLRALLVVQTRARLRFAYRVSVEVGDRVGLERPLTALVATTDHCCLNPRTGRPVPFPQAIYEGLARARALVDLPSAAPAAPVAEDT